MGCLKLFVEDMECVVFIGDREYENCKILNSGKRGDVGEKGCIHFGRVSILFFVPSSKYGERA